ncbi:MAG: hypothetical protein QXD86_04775 [Candidatus Bathyarchaeia archaeon]
MPTSSLILPFAVRVEEGGEVISPDVELASALLLAEAQRKRLGLLSHGENLAYLSKVYYPFWLVPWRDRCLLLDGLAVASSTIAYKKLPSLDAFIEDLERCRLRRSLFKDFLSRHLETFTGFRETIESKFNALLSDGKLLTSMADYIRSAISSPTDVSIKVALLPLKVDSKAAVEVANQLSIFYENVDSDILGLEYVKKLLIEALNFHEEMLSKELNFIRRTYGEKLSVLKSQVEERVKKIEDRWSAEVSKVKKAFEKEVKAKEQELKRREKELQKLESQRAGLKGRLETIKGRGAAAQARLEYSIKVCDAKIHELRDKIRNLSKLLEEARRRYEAEVEMISRKYQESIEKEKASITQLENEMNMEVQSRCAEMESIKAVANTLIDYLNGLIEEKGCEKRRIEALTIPWNVSEASLVCVPFYLVGYRADGKVRLAIIPPLRASSSTSVMKTLREKLLGFGLASKLKFYMHPRCKTLARAMDLGVKAILDSGEASSRALKSIVSSANLLSSRSFKQLLANGVKKLKDEGFIGDKEAEIISSKYLGDAYVG